MGKVIKRILLITLAALLIAIAAFGIYLACVQRVRLDTALLDGVGSVTVYLDGDGAPIRENVSGKNATFAPVEELSETTLDAFVCTEDKRFYTHRGIDWRRLLSAGLTNLFRGDYAQGASTITQQLAKNTHLSFDKKLSRKVQELRLAREIERRYDKREILEKYLNVIYFGHNLYGIESAAQYYFGKRAAELRVEEAATLAAVINAPARYSPVLKPANALARRNLILNNMRENGKLDDREYRRATAAPIELAIRERTGAYYVAAARAEALAILDRLGLGGTGYTIRTHMRPELQKTLEDCRTDAHRQKFVLTDRGGRILAAAGSFDSVNLKRQPGSAIKPLIAYAPAVERRIICPGTPILDEPIDFGGYTPGNYGGGHLGWISARDALAHSNNIAAVKLMDACGVEYSCETAKRLGLELDERDRNYAAALGGLTYGVTLEALTAAYATLAAEGALAQPRYVSTIEKNGAVLYRASAAPPTRVLGSETAHVLTDMLRTCAESGTAAKLAGLPFEVAAKTGTVGAADGGNTDAYCVGYTSEYALGVWYGAENEPLPDQIRGGTLPAAAAERLWRAVYRDRSPAGFGYELARYRLDKAAMEHDHLLALAPAFAAEKDVFYEVFPQDTHPLPVRLRAPHLDARLGDGVVEFRIAGDRYADYRLLKSAPLSSEMIAIGRLGRAAETVFCDFDVDPHNLYSYRLIALYPDGTSSITDPVKIIT